MLRHYSVEDLEREIAIRKAKHEAMASKPKALEVINWNPVLETAQEVIDAMWDGTYHDDNDDKQYLYEAVMQAIYGRGIFTKINKVL